MCKDWNVSQSLLHYYLINKKADCLYVKNNLLVDFRYQNLQFFRPFLIQTQIHGSNLIKISKSKYSSKTVAFEMLEKCACDKCFASLNLSACFLFVLINTCVSVFLKQLSKVQFWPMLFFTSPSIFFEVAMVIPCCHFKELLFFLLKLKLTLFVLLVIAGSKDSDCDLILV